MSVSRSRRQFLAVLAVSGRLGASSGAASRRTTPAPLFSERGYDRDGSSMCPDGSFSRDWGSRVPTAYEQFDRAAAGEVARATLPNYATLADFDTALRAVWAGTATPNQALVAADLDLLLAAVRGNLLSRGQPPLRPAPGGRIFGEFARGGSRRENRAGFRRAREGAGLPRPDGSPAQERRSTSRTRAATFSA